MQDQQGNHPLHLVRCCSTVLLTRRTMNSPHLSWRTVPLRQFIYSDVSRVLLTDLVW